MQYVSTRDAHRRVSGAQAIVQGISPDGGLFTPVEFPKLPENWLDAMITLDYPNRATRILTPWLPEFGESALLSMCRAACARFSDPRVAPVVKLGSGPCVLELFHGPTLAFKDVALTLLPHLLTAAAKKTGETREILILVATSGDTGKAALEGFMDVPGVRICVYYPNGGVSEAQRLQMVTQAGKNTRVVAVNGNFDDTQTGVKRIFTSREKIDALSARGFALSSANSINLGRLLPQIAYYVSGYLDMAATGQIALGEKINICVPTGNFGNILAARYAVNMGLPVNKLVCASNENDVLTDFIRTGIYDRNRAFKLTTSPSMDILVSSNLERLLFEVSGYDDAAVRLWMRDLAEKGVYGLSRDQHQQLQSLLWGGYAPEDAVFAEIARAFEEDGYLADPHTAVALHVARAYRAQTGDNTPILVDATASPFKFGKSVLRALTGKTPEEDDFACCAELAKISGQRAPEAIMSLREKPIRHKCVCEKDGMWEALLPVLTQAQA